MAELPFNCGCSARTRDSKGFETKIHTTPFESVRAVPDAPPGLELETSAQPQEAHRLNISLDIFTALFSVDREPIIVQVGKAV